MAQDLPSSAQVNGFDNRFSQCPPKEWLPDNINEHLVEPDFLALEPYLVSIDVLFPILNKVKTRSSEYTWKLRSSYSERLSTNTEIDKRI